MSEQDQPVEPHYVVVLASTTQAGIEVEIQAHLNMDHLGGWLVYGLVAGSPVSEAHEIPSMGVMELFDLMNLSMAEATGVIERTPA